MINKVLLGHVLSFTVLLVLCFLAVGSSDSNTKNTDTSSSSVNQNETISNAPTEYKISGEEIVIYTGPGKKYKKLINKKATEILGQTQYAQVDESCKVKILEEEGEWAKIQVVDPDWLSSTHIGWIQNKNIVRESNDDMPLEKLDPNLYSIIKTKHNPSVQNFFVLVKNKDFNKDSIKDFIKKFRSEYCSKSSNVNVYDSDSIIGLLDIYPLNDADYLKMADHYVAASNFDCPDIIQWYPFQDFKYKELGGKNWKTEPIK